MTRFVSLTFACGLLFGIGEAKVAVDPATSASAPRPLVGANLQSSLRQPELVATWGCTACTGPELLGSVVDVAVSADGAVFVLDSFEPAVRRFSVDGEPLAFGREGQGPGEFELAYYIGMVEDESIEVIDLRRRRLTRLDFDGNVVATRPLQAWLSAAAYSPVDGGWYLAAVDFRRGGSRVLYLADDSEEPHHIGGADFPLDEDGDLSDFFALAARPGGGYAVGDGEIEYRVRLYDAEGVALGDISRSIERVAKTEAELNAERERRNANSAQVAERRAAEARASGLEITERDPIDPFKHHFYGSSLGFDDAGRLWLRSGRGNESITTFDVFDPARMYLGEVHIEGRVGRHAIAGEWLVTAGTSAEDHPVVRLWRLSGS